jgi:hypothetical protein
LIDKKLFANRVNFKLKYNRQELLYKIEKMFNSDNNDLEKSKFQYNLQKIFSEHELFEESDLLSIVEKVKDFNLAKTSEPKLKDEFLNDLNEVEENISNGSAYQNELLKHAINNDQKKQSLKKSLNNSDDEIAIETLNEKFSEIMKLYEDKEKLFYNSPIIQVVAEPDIFKIDNIDPKKLDDYIDIKNQSSLTNSKSSENIKFKEIISQFYGDALYKKKYSQNSFLEKYHKEENTLKDSDLTTYNDHKHYDESQSEFSKSPLTKNQKHVKKKKNILFKTMNIFKDCKQEEIINDGYDKQNKKIFLKKVNNFL